MTSKFSTVHWIIMFAIAASGLYLVKYQVKDISYEVKSLEREIAQEQEAMALLQAEWSYLNRPERLQKLSQRYLKLEPYDTRAVTAIRALPAKEQQMVSR